MEDFCAWLNIPCPKNYRDKWLISIIDKYSRQIFFNLETVRTWLLKNVRCLQTFDHNLLSRGGSYPADTAFLNPMPKIGTRAVGYLRELIIANQGKNVVAFRRWDIVDLTFAPEEFIPVMLPRLLRSVLTMRQCEALIHYQVGLARLTPRDKSRVLANISSPKYQVDEENRAFSSGVIYLLTAN